MESSPPNQQPEQPSPSPSSESPRPVVGKPAPSGFRLIERRGGKEEAPTPTPDPRDAAVDALKQAATPGAPPPQRKRLRVPAEIIHQPVVRFRCSRCGATNESRKPLTVANIAGGYTVDTECGNPACRAELEMFGKSSLIVARPPSGRPPR
jgi:hypothetical protein